MTSRFLVTTALTLMLGGTAAAQTSNPGGSAADPATVLPANPGSISQDTNSSLPGVDNSTVTGSTEDGTAAADPCEERPGTTANSNPTAETLDIPDASAACQ